MKMPTQFTLVFSGKFKQKMRIPMTMPSTSETVKVGGLKFKRCEIFGSQTVRGTLMEKFSTS